MSLIYPFHRNIFYKESTSKGEGKTIYIPRPPPEEISYNKEQLDFIFLAS